MDEEDDELRGERATGEDEDVIDPRGLTTAGDGVRAVEDEDSEPRGERAALATGDGVRAEIDELGDGVRVEIGELELEEL